MAYPANSPDKKPELRELRDGRRVLKKACRHCGESVEVALDMPQTVLPSSVDMDGLLLAMADRMCCDKCAREHMSRREAERLQGEARRMIERKQVLAGFGRHALAKSAPELEIANRKAWTAARGWLENPTTNVVIMGDPDSGKTWLARTLVMESWVKGRVVMEATGWDLFSGGLLYHSEEIAAYTQRLRSCHVLYIQGLDRGEPKAKHLDLLLNIMEERYERGVITIVETQLDGEGICSKWERLTGDPAIGGDILSRLHPMTKITMERTRRDGAEIGMRQLAAMHGSKERG